MHSVFRGTGAALLHTSGSGISPAPHAVHRHGLRNPAAAATAKKPANSVRGFGSTLAKPRKPKKKPKKDPNKEQWDFEQLMLYWDDVFKASCEDAERAAEVFEIARHGYSKNGRGCVLISAQLHSRFKAPGRSSKVARQRAEASKPEPAGDALSTNPDLLLDKWNAVYLPAAVLLQLGRLFTNDDGVDLPDGSGLVAPRPAQEDSGPLDGVALNMLQRAMRGIDNVRLLTLAGVLPEGMPNTGEQEYAPDNDELVLLLWSVVDGRPSIGADIVAAELQPESGTLRLSTPGLE